MHTIIPLYVLNLVLIIMIVINFLEFDSRLQNLEASSKDFALCLAQRDLELHADFAGAFQDEAVVCYCDVRKTFLRPGLTDVLEDMDGNWNSVDHGAGGKEGSRGFDRVDGGLGVECMLMSPYSTLPAGEKASSEKLRLQKLGNWEGLCEFCLLLLEKLNPK